MEKTQLDQYKTSSDTAVLDSRSKEIRQVIVKMVTAAKRGHLASAFSLVEILRVLFDDVLRLNPKYPKDPERDRFILSKGHGCLALYALMAEKGFFPESELWKVGKTDGILGGHPEYGKIPGVEVSTGSLGHGLSVGIGFALYAKYRKAKHRVWVVIGDGESNEGSVWEAALCAGKHQLENLIVAVDYNKFQSYGPTSEVQNLEPYADKWKSFGFAVLEEVNGHSVSELQAAFSNIPLVKGRPTAIICHTVKGKGVSYVENNLDWHHKNSITEQEVNSLMSALGAK